MVKPLDIVNKVLYRGLSMCVCDLILSSLARRGDTNGAARFNSVTAAVRDSDGRGNGGRGGGTASGQAHSIVNV